MFLLKFVQQTMHGHECDPCPEVDFNGTDQFLDLASVDGSSFDTHAWISFIKIHASVSKKEANMSTNALSHKKVFELHPILDLFQNLIDSSLTQVSPTNKISTKSFLYFLTGKQ